MKLPTISSLLLMALCAGVRADEPKPEPTVAELQAEVESLKFQLAQLQTVAQFEISLCQGSLNAARQFMHNENELKAKQLEQRLAKPQTSQSPATSKPKLH